MSEAQRESIVKVPEKEAKVLRDGSHPESELSLIDCLMLPLMTKYWFFYDYDVGTHVLEKALETTLSRYQELAGRLHSRKVILNNEGAKLEILKDSSLTLAEIEENDYNFDQLIQLVGAEKPFGDVFLMILTKQKLACGGMILMFSFNHFLCDANSGYIFVADFASQVKNSTFKFDQQEVITEKRSLMLAPSGSPPTLDHEEFTVMSKQEQRNSLKEYYNEKAPPKIAKLKLSVENKQKLKSFVCGMGEPGISVSCNDCLVSLIWSVFIEVSGVKEIDNEVSSTLHLYCNGRFRKQPVVPISFFGNVILTLTVTRKVHQFSEASLLTTAQKVREKIASVNNEYIQSTIDYRATNENSQIVFPGKYDFMVSNWDGPPLEWYRDADLGFGTPTKFTNVSPALNRICIVLPDRDGGIEAVLGLESDLMERFREHFLIRRFFEF